MTMNDHRSKYGAMVTEQTRQYVKARFGLDELRKAMAIADNLNSIPVRYWDNMSPIGVTFPGKSHSLADKVCALKEAARQVVEATDTI